MELEKKLILDEAPSVAKPARARDNARGHMDSISRQTALKQTRIDKQNKIDTQDWRSDGLDEPNVIEKEFETSVGNQEENTEHQLEIIHKLFQKFGIDNPKSSLNLSIVKQFLTPIIWIDWFRSMKAKEILKGPEKNVFMHILADQRCFNVVLKDKQVFYTVYNSYVQNFLDNTLADQTDCGKNFLTLVLNPSTYATGQSMKDVMRTFQLTNNLIEKANGHWTEVFDIVCDPKTKNFKKYDDIETSEKKVISREPKSNESENDYVKRVQKASVAERDDLATKTAMILLQDKAFSQLVKAKQNEFKSKQ